MYAVPLEKIYEKIHVKTLMGIPEIKEKVRAKLEQLSGLISEEGAAHIVANELGVKLFESPGLLKIADLLSGMRGVDVQGRVVRKYEQRDFTTRDGRAGKVANILLGDESGLTRAVFWNAQVDRFDELQEGTIIRIRNAQVKDNNGRSEIHANDSSTVDLNPVGVSIAVTVRQEQQEQSARKYISDLHEGESNVALLGAIVQVFDLRFFEVCPQCNKRVRESEAGWLCPTHQKVVPVHNYVLSLILDDGTGTVRITCWRDQVKQLVRKTHEELLLYRETPSGFEDVKMALLGAIVKCVGRVQKNASFDRIEFVAQTIVPNPNPEDELKTLMDAHLSPKAPVPDLSSRPIQAARPAVSASARSEDNSAAPVVAQEYFEEDV